MFSLPEAIRAALDESSSPDPHEVAARVASAIPDPDVREVLASLLPAAVREQIRVQRGTAPRDDEPVADRGEAPANGKRDLGALTHDPLRWRVHVPGRGWTFYGDLTAEECEAIAEWYLAAAEQNENQAKRYRGLADRLRRAGVATVRELGDQASEAA